MTTIVRDDGFDLQLELVTVERARADAAVAGLETILVANPKAWHEEPGTAVRCAVARAYPGAENLKCVYTYDETTDQVTLLGIAVV